MLESRERRAVRAEQRQEGVMRAALLCAGVQPGQPNGCAGSGGGIMAVRGTAVSVAVGTAVTVTGGNAAGCTAATDTGVGVAAAAAASATGGAICIRCFVCFILSTCFSGQVRLRAPFSRVSRSNFRNPSSWLPLPPCRQFCAAP